MAVRVLQFSIVFTIKILLAFTAYNPVAKETEVQNITLTLKDPKDVVVGANESVTLKCDAESKFNNLTYNWLFNNEFIPISDKYRKIQLDGSLVIQEMYVMDNFSLEGNYSCLVNNSLGALLSNPAKVQIAKLDGFLKEPTNITVIQKQPVVLPCFVKSLPKPLIYWERNNHPLPDSNRYVLLPSGALYITNVFSVDIGFYRCKVVNEILKKALNSNVVYLNVLNSSLNVQAPKFLDTDLQTQISVTVGSNLTLYCIPTAWPLPSIKWFYNEHLIGNETTLNLYNISLNRSGYYTCSAQNSANLITKKYFVDVLMPPSFNNAPASSTFPVARLVRLYCEAVGVPSPSITWLKNAKPIPNEPRIKLLKNGIVFSHTFSDDAGIYQCIAENKAGKIWSSAELIPTKDKKALPKAPQKMRCEPYNETSICVTWEPPDNVIPKAYTLYSIKTSYYNNKFILNETGPDYLIKENPFILATGLKQNTNYTFYSRLYSNDASDSSEYVTCLTGVRGKRNLQIQKLNDTSVQVKWSNISSDITCGSSNISYTLLWRIFNHFYVNEVVVQDFNVNITNLLPSTIYEFNVYSSKNKNSLDDWVQYTFPSNANIQQLNTNTTNETDILPLPPFSLEYEIVSSSVINLKWNDTNNFEKYYSICFFESKEKRDCNTKKYLTSFSNSIKISKLKTNSHYLFRIRTHKKNGGHSTWSQVLEIYPDADVPPKVRELEYKIINKSSVCIKWKTPVFNSGKLSKFVVLYTSDLNWPLDKWHHLNVSVFQKKNRSCWAEQSETFSLLLNNLKSEKHYTVLVRAATDLRLGKAAPPITIYMKNISEENTLFYENDENKIDDIYFKQKLGIALGILLSFICIILCILCLIYQRRKIKQQAAARARITSNNFCSLNSGSYVPSRIQDNLTAEAYEMQHLVEPERPKEISIKHPSFDLNCLDAVPAKEKIIQDINCKCSNGHLSNHLINITENPQYFHPECNGNLNFAKNCQTFKNAVPILSKDDNNFNNSQMCTNKKSYEGTRYKMNNSLNESPSSNVSNLSFKNQDIDNSLEVLETTLNSTQLTCLDTSFPTSIRTNPPCLGPNG